MGDVVNLRMVRKVRRRAEADAAADSNRAAHGRTKAERDAARREAAKAVRHLDGHRRDETT